MPISILNRKLEFEKSILFADQDITTIFFQSACISTILYQLGSVKMAAQRNQGEGLKLGGISVAINKKERFLSVLGLIPLISGNNYQNRQSRWFSQ